MLSRLPARGRRCCFALRTVTKSRGKFCAKHGHLFALLDIFNREGVCLQFILTDDDDVTGVHLFGGFETFLKTEALVANVDDESGIAKFAREFESVAIRAGPKRSDVGVN